MSPSEANEGLLIGPAGTVFALHPKPVVGGQPVQLWQVGTGATQVIGPALNPGSRVVTSPDGATVAFVDSKGSAELWRYSSDTTASRTVTLDEEVTGIAFSADGKLVATLERSQLNLWRLGDGPHEVDPVARVAIDGPMDASAFGFGRDGNLYASTKSGLSVWPTAPATIRSRVCELARMRPGRLEQVLPGVRVPVSVPTRGMRKLLWPDQS